MADAGDPQRNRLLLLLHRALSQYAAADDGKHADAVKHVDDADAQLAALVARWNAQKRE